MRDIRKLWWRAGQGPAAERCSAGQPLRLRSGQARAAVPTWFVAGVELVLATFREIFDESAYARFLVRRGVVHSRQAYAEFLRERAGERERRPRCC